MSAGFLYRSVMLSCNELRRILDYNPENGVFVWKVRKSDKTKIGQVAGCFSRYCLIRIDGKRYLAHRLAWLYMTGDWPSAQIDHANGDKFDNRWSNLRLATPSQNNANVGIRSNNTSGFKGVTWHKRNGAWQAQIAYGNCYTYLGQFKTKEEAAAAYQSAASQMHKEYARV